MHRSKLFIGLIAGLGVGLGALTASAKPLEIRISWAVAPAHLTALLPINTSMYRHYGKSYVIKPMRMRGSGPALQAIAAGEVDIGADDQFQAAGLLAHTVPACAEEWHEP